MDREAVMANMVCTEQEKAEDDARQAENASGEQLEPEKTYFFRCLIKDDYSMDKNN